MAPRCHASRSVPDIIKNKTDAIAIHTAGRVYSRSVNRAHGRLAVCRVHRTAIHTAGST